jgi:uncharacterized coiled-coil DUF342 family protein
LNRILTEDFPLKYETQLFDNIFGLLERIDAAKHAQEIHQKISAEYEDMKQLNVEVDKNFAEAHAFYEESQKNHEKMLEIYNESRELRKKADEYHKQLVEHYNLMSPIWEKINALKEETNDLRDVISVYNDAVDKVRAEKESEKMKEYAAGAKEKLDKKKRMDINELRILMEQGMVKLK